jgi:hypothetical protein
MREGKKSQFAQNAQERIDSQCVNQFPLNHKGQFSMVYISLINFNQKTISTGIR